MCIIFGHHRCASSRHTHIFRLSTHFVYRLYIHIIVKFTRFPHNIIIISIHSHFPVVAYTPRRGRRNLAQGRASVTSGTLGIGHLHTLRPESGSRERWNGSYGNAFRMFPLAPLGRSPPIAFPCGRFLRQPVQHNWEMHSLQVLFPLSMFAVKKRLHGDIVYSIC